MSKAHIPGIFKTTFLLFVFSALALPDQIMNGNFSAGNASFNSAYTLVPANGTVQTGPGNYGLTKNPGTGFTNGYATYSDHTGDAAGLMLFLDGYNPGVNAWSQVVSVASSSTYTFTAWVASAYPADFAVLGLFVNGSQVGASFNAPTTVGIWTQWSASLITGPATSQITLAIQDLNPNVYAAGDDFTLDDLSFNGPAPATVPEPASCLLLAIGSLIGAISFLAVKLCRRAEL